MTIPLTLDSGDNKNHHLEYEKHFVDGPIKRKNQEN